MRGVVAIALSACYAPSEVTGVLCDPDQAVCPLGQVCTAVAGEHRCEVSATPGDATTDTRYADARVDGRPDAPVGFAYVAKIAACIDPQMPSPASCVEKNGAHQLVVDAQDSVTLDPWVGYVRFDLDAALQGHTVTAVHLEMTATTAGKAPSDSSGVVWLSAPFTTADLSVAAPAKIGATAIAPSQGAVAIGDVVTWPLPASLVAPNGSVYLELESSSNDGVNYWDLSGDRPPRLLIDGY